MLSDDNARSLMSRLYPTTSGGKTNIPSRLIMLTMNRATTTRCCQSATKNHRGLISKKATHRKTLNCESSWKLTTCNYKIANSPQVSSLTATNRSTVKTPLWKPISTVPSPSRTEAPDNRSPAFTNELRALQSSQNTLKCPKYRCRPAKNGEHPTATQSRKQEVPVTFSTLTKTAAWISTFT